ncbi:hypothetical protein [Escherichia phage ZCEC13]|uniref:Uncharacterized protein n=1 Tax=Escherichia phage ZCEC13 TaxID=2935866 RepID=A0AAE9HFT7_9CAUD|nr:hypothetical protein [Escherichia phage ZCEC13]
MSAHKSHRGHSRWLCSGLWSCMPVATPHRARRRFQHRALSSARLV